MSSKALTDKILRTAEGEAEAITAEILKRAGENERLILSKADAECKLTTDAAEEKAEQIKRTASLMAELDARKAQLHAKREVADEAYKKAFEKLLGLPDGKRYEFICGLIKKYAPAPVITVTLAEGDKRLFEDGSLSELEAALSLRFDAPSKITVSDKPAKFRGGVFMESDISDVDASFEALFEELKRETEAKVSRILFG